MPWILSAFLIAPTLAAAQDEGPQGPGQEPPAVEERDLTRAQLTAEQRAALSELLEQGDLPAARALLDRYTIQWRLEQARAAVAAGEPRRALEPLDRALAIDEQDVDALLLRAEVAWLSAPTDARPQIFYDDAAQYFERASRAQYARTRELGMLQFTCLARQAAALRLALQGELALSGARRAAQLRGRLRERGVFTEGPVEGLGTTLERVWAECAFGQYVAARQAGEEASELFGETEAQLELAAGTPSEREWALLQLSNLYQWRGDAAQALALAERALEFGPSNQEAHGRLVQLLGGADAIVERYARFREVHPDEPLGWWYPGSALFDQGLMAYEAGDLQPGLFERAEAMFQGCLNLEPPYAQACRNQLAVCRAGAGWCHFYAEDLAAAQAAFESMEAVQPRGMTVELPGRLGSGVVGLTQVARQHHTAGLRGDVERALQATRIADALFAYDPGDGNLANNAGFVNRDAAVLLERLHAAGAEGSEGYRERAIEVMDTSWAAYQRAAELLPTDVRVVNDAGLIMLYYVRSDADLAERLLLQADVHGTAQLGELEAAGLDDPVLREAYGDVHENLALLYLTLKPDLAKAEHHMQRCLDIGGPNPRGIIPQAFRPLAARLGAGETLGPEDLAGLVWAHRP